MAPPHVALREIAPGDLPALFDQQRDEASYRMAAVPPRDRPAFDAHWERVLADPANVVRTVLADGTIAGHVTSFVLDGRRQVGYWIAREHWGRGIASAALPLLLEQVPDRPLHATVADHNPASLRVLEKAGFRRVGERHDGGVRLLALRLE